MSHVHATDLPLVTATALHALIPRVQAGDAEWFEVPDVAGDDGHVRGLGNSSDECIVERSGFGDSVGGQDPSGRQVERQHSVRERRQDAIFEPPAQYIALERVGSGAAFVPAGRFRIRICSTAITSDITFTNSSVSSQVEFAAGAGRERVGGPDVVVEEGDEVTMAGLSGDPVDRSAVEYGGDGVASAQ